MQNFDEEFTSPNLRCFSRAEAYIKAGADGIFYIQGIKINRKKIHEKVGAMDQNTPVVVVPTIFFTCLQMNFIKWV